MAMPELANLAVDHVLILVRDLASSKEIFERLGFFVTERGTHTKFLGTGNHCIILQDDYFELLGVVAPTEKNEAYRSLLQEREGLIGFALATRDAEANYDAFKAHGFTINPAREYGRPVEVDGRQEQVAFKSAFISDDPVTGPVTFFCEHMTPHLIWHSPWQSHPNTATGIASLTVVGDDPRGVGQYYQRMLAPHGAAAEEDGKFAFEMGRCHYQVLSRQRAAQEYPNANLTVEGGTELIALGIRVNNLPTAREVMTAGGVQLEDIPLGFRVAPREACGAVVEFCE